MHSPVSTQALAHLRDASGPSPVFRMSMMPEMTATGSALTPPGPVTGQTSTHLPQRVQASAIAATRSVSAVSKVTVTWPRSLGAKSGREYSSGGGDETPPGARLIGGTNGSSLDAMLEGVTVGRQRVGISRE